MKAKMAIAKKLQEGDKKTCKQWLEMTEPETYSLRHHRSAYGDLRRRLGLHAKTLPPIDHKKEYERLKNGLDELRKELNLAP
jgi:hypothetical protein